MDESERSKRRRYEMRKRYEKDSPSVLRARRRQAADRIAVIDAILSEKSIKTSA